MHGIEKEEDSKERVSEPLLKTSIKIFLILY